MGETSWGRGWREELVGRWLKMVAVFRHAPTCLWETKHGNQLQSTYHFRRIQIIRFYGDLPTNRFCEIGTSDLLCFTHHPFKRHRYIWWATFYPSSILKVSDHLMGYVLPPSVIFKEIGPSDLLCFSAQSARWLETRRGSVGGWWWVGSGDS